VKTFLNITALAAFAMILTGALPGIASAAPPKPALVGTWKVAVTCSHFDYVNTVVISVASASQVLGSTRHGSDTGKIVGGSFAGTSASFTNKYRLKGKSYAEHWTAALSQNGKVVRGTMTADNPDMGGVCRYTGTLK
jgi:hypothetical protein